jgi:hypothetical protein
MDPNANPTRPGPLRHARRSRLGFVLLEVIVSFTILGVVVMACMRSFTLSLKAVRMMEIHTQALFLAQQLMEEFEIFPPEGDDADGVFGEAYEAFTYHVNVNIADPNYGQIEGDEGIDQYFAMRELEIEIWYDAKKGANPVRVLTLPTAMIGFEKFSAETKASYAFF